MGRKKIAIELVADQKIRHVTLKQRRLGLLKKAMQLSKLTGAKVQLKIFSLEDQSLVEYFSNRQDDFDDIDPKDQQIDEYAKFFNCHYDFISQFDYKNVRTAETANQSENFWFQQILKKSKDLNIECKNIIHLFSQAKKQPIKKLNQWNGNESGFKAANESIQEMIAQIQNVTIQPKNSQIIGQKRQRIDNYDQPSQFLTQRQMLNYDQPQTNDNFGQKSNNGLNINAKLNITKTQEQILGQSQAQIVKKLALYDKGPSKLKISKRDLSYFHQKLGIIQRLNMPIQNNEDQSANSNDGLFRNFVQSFNQTNLKNFGALTRKEGKLGDELRQIENKTVEKPQPQKVNMNEVGKGVMVIVDQSSLVAQPLNLAFLEQQKLQ